MVCFHCIWILTIIFWHNSDKPTSVFLDIFLEVYTNRPNGILPRVYSVYKPRCPSTGLPCRNWINEQLKINQHQQWISVHALLRISFQCKPNLTSKVITDLSRYHQYVILQSSFRQTTMFGWFIFRRHLGMWANFSFQSSSQTTYQSLCGRSHYTNCYRRGFFCASLECIPWQQLVRPKRDRCTLGHRYVVDLFQIPEVFWFSVANFQQNYKR